jgi:four helix bundle protein
MVLTSQIAESSIPTNISEGFGRNSDKSLITLILPLGSVCENRIFIDLSKDQKIY